MREGCIYIYGGYDADGYCSSDIYCFHLQESYWDKISANKLHSKEFSLERFHHCAVSTDNAMIVFGGKDSSGKVCSADLLEFHYSTKTWTSIQTIGIAPCPRWGHSVTCNG